MNPPLSSEPSSKPNAPSAKSDGHQPQASAATRHPISSPVASDPKKLHSLRALGKDDPPESITLPNTTWTRTEIIKHDFFAATAFYASPAGEKAVLKIGRTLPWCGLPLQWIGQRLCNREVRIYQKLHDLPNIPNVLGRVGKTGFLHAYVEGRPLDKNKPTPDGFFKQLEALFRELHRRNIAYVDTNKPQNILLGDDGRPYLIDFQISWDRGPRFFLRRLQKSDLYHLLKHRRRMRPDELTPDELEQSKRVGFWIKLHRTLTKPYFFLRRKLFRKLEKDGRLLPSGSD